MCVHELFAARAGERPEARALAWGDATMTYEVLDARANRLAHHLRHQGVGRGSLVAVCVERGPDFVVALLGVLKAGGGYVPLDPSHPAERIASLVRGADPVRVVTRTATARRLSLDPDRTVLLDEERPLIDRLPASAPAVAVAPDDVACVMFTSGSTGGPKGVVSTHRAILRTFFGQDYIEFGPDQVSLQCSPVSWDVLALELWSVLLHGGRCVLAPGQSPDPATLATLVADHGVTTLWLSAGLFAVVADEHPQVFARLRQVMTGGETPSVSHVRRIRRRFPRLRMVHGYGPVESMVFATCHRITEEDGADGEPIPLGSPIANTRVYLLDSALEPVPLGVPGEIHIAGDGLARGYLGQPRHTADRFVPDPYGPPGTRLYRTGDLARRHPDGHLEFLGRTDHQLKIRGFRIEPTEIETTLTQHPHVHTALVTAHRAGGVGSPRLVAYLVGTPDQAPAQTVTEHTDEWRHVFDRSQGPGRPDSPFFDLAGWTSSYTGEPIPADEMRTWVESTVSRIRGTRARRVLEIGCGTGLLLWRLAPHADQYVGTDFSASTLDSLGQALRAGGLDHKVRLVHREADDFTGFTPGEFDTVVVNSVVQYFPDKAYLDRVLRGAARLLAPGGTLFVGDVRNLALLTAHHCSVEWSRGARGARLARRVARQTARERELLVSPRHFTAFCGPDREFTSLEVLPKRGRAHNELTKFRYDVLLRKAGRPREGTPAGAPAEVAAWYSWDADGITAGWLRERLAGGGSFGVLGVPNARVRTDVALAAGQGARTVPHGDAIDPEDLWEWAEEHGHHAAVSWAAGRPDGSVDVAFIPAGAATEPLRAVFPDTGGPSGDTTNDPLRARFLGEARRDLVPAVLAFLAGKLPSHMIPSAFVLLDRLPLTENGKVDRRALPEPDGDRPDWLGESTAPRDAWEEILAGLFGDVLGVEDVGVHDDFFELGGHSLSATRLVSRVRSRLGVELPLGEVFTHRTVARLAARVAGGGRRTVGELPGRLPVARAEGALPLSFAQRRLWFLEQLDPGTARYHVPCAVRLRGPLDMEALRHALAGVVRRHETLRTTFSQEGGVPRQTVHEPGPVPLRVEDVSAAADPQAQARERVADELSRPFDLGDAAPPWRILLVRTGADDHVLCVVLHHLISDGWSLGVLLRELSVLYRAFDEGAPSPLPDLPVQYGDFAVWQQEWLTEDFLRPQSEYWQDRLAGAPAALELPTDRPRPAVPTGRGATVDVEIPPDVAERLRALSRDQGVTLYMTLLGAFQVLLSRWTGTTDVTVASPAAGRRHPDVEGLIGFFVNTLVMRTDCSGNPSFTDILHRVRETALGAYAHQDLPFERVVEQLAPVRDRGRTPLAQAVFQLLNVPRSTLELPGVRGEPFDAPDTTIRTDLECHLTEEDGRLSGRIVYSTDLFDRGTVERFAGHFQRLLAGVADDPERPVGRIGILTEEERESVLHAWNAPATGLSDGRCFHELFEAQVRRTPHATAVLCGRRRVSYAELNARANQLARLLAAHGVGPETPVAVMLPRSVSAVVAQLAVVKAGGAHLPLDPQLPAQRVSLVLEDARPVCLLTDSGTAAAVPGTTACARIVLDDPGTAARIGACPDGDLTDAERGAPLSVDSPAYVIYTSGSTGVPKGVVVTHRGLEPLRASLARRLGVTGDSRVLRFASPGFDAAWGEVCLALLSGAALVVADAARLLPGPALSALVAETGVTVLSLPPSALGMLDEKTFPEGVTVVVAGEACPPGLVDRWAPGLRMVNAYGPTEATVCSTTSGPLRAGERPSLGSPIANTRVYLLDSALEPVPLGVPGEIHIAGDGLARGYLGQPRHTADRFVPDPYGPPGTRLYRTGDLARRHPDGHLEFLGRTDHQLKIRGFRIEPTEIETTLTQHPHVHTALVTAHQPADGPAVLVAYWTSQPAAAPGAAPSPAELRRHVSDRLPRHLVPSAFVRLGSLPLTPSGKVDRAALPAPVFSASESRQAPRTPTEEAVAEIWGRVLGVEQVGVEDSFFELGGHSLLIPQVIARVYERLSVELPVETVFSCETVAALAAAVDRAKLPGARPVHRVDLVAEAVLDPEITAVPHGRTPAGAAPPAAARRILLTGATGFLGAFLLRELLDGTDAEVWCLVRAPGEREAHERIRRNLEGYGLWDGVRHQRIVAVPGDLELPLLGLGAERFAFLADAVDVIHHNGAAVNGAAPYHRLKAANVLGTQEILRLATRSRTKPVHYVSTSAVALGTGTPPSRPLPERRADPALLPPGGYIASKWVAEELVRTAGARGVPTAIHRPGRVSGDSRTGVCGRDDAFWNLVRAMVTLGAVPELPGAHGFTGSGADVGLVPVDYVARAIVYLSTSRSAHGETYHLTGGRPVAFGTVVRRLVRNGYRLDGVPYAQWRALLDDGPDELAPARLLAGTLQDLPRTGAFRFDRRNVLAGLAGSPVRCPGVDENLLDTYIGHFVASGFLPAPPPPSGRR
ncbi:amino acid adenylation domain-containing protein [Streptomyces sp. HMX112]|uniref:amino acid adenylation domain-containing protein n=1 Tax=Streptomyces sp. HMX112 TaxID=3390850 RepID=UPI003A80CC3F